MEIATIIISALSLVAVVIMMVILLTKKPDTQTNNDSLKEIGALGKQIELMGQAIKGDIEKAVAAEIIKMQNASTHINEAQDEKLERFQRTITESLNTRFDSFNQQLELKINELNAKVDAKLADGFKSTSETMAQVRERLQAIDVAQKNIEALSTDVISLKNVLENNQSRGRYGEYQLSMVLHNVFGDTIGCYEEQYSMKKTRDGNDVRTDAVVFMPEPNKMICIDSKFPFSEYQKLLDAETEEEKASLLKAFSADVKKHITAIKDKYIVENKTAPEAIMFIPNDGVFAFIYHNCDDVVEYARSQKVILTSPSTLPSILVTINMVRIEVERTKNIQIITKQLNTLGKQFELFARDWETFSRQLETVSKSREKFDKRVDTISTKFTAISAVEMGTNEVEEIATTGEE